MEYVIIILWLNNLSSVALVIACWWLAHTYSVAGFPHGKLIASLWGLLGISVTVTAFARNLYIDPNPSIIITKVILCVLSLIIARRVSLRSKEPTPLLDD